MEKNYEHSHPTRNHLLKAVPRDVSVMRYIDILKNGYARPSFAADSALRIFRKFTGTCLMANLPPTMAAQIIGSVGVRQAAMTRDETYVKRGKRP